MTDSVPLISGPYTPLFEGDGCLSQKTPEVLHSPAASLKKTGTSREQDPGGFAVLIISPAHGVLTSCATPIESLALSEHPFAAES